MLKDMMLFNEAPRSGQERLSYGMGVQANMQDLEDILEGEILVQQKRIGLQGTRYNLKFVLSKVFENYYCKGVNYLIIFYHGFLGLSVSTVLAMLRVGAKGNTLQQINDALYLPKGRAAGTGYRF